MPKSAKALPLMAVWLASTPALGFNVDPNADAQILSPIDPTEDLQPVWPRHYSTLQYMGHCEQDGDCASPLACDVLTAGRDSEGHPRFSPFRKGHANCTVRPLVGFSYNPSVIEAPAEVIAAAAAAGVKGVKYMATDRVPANNKRVMCTNPWVEEHWERRHGFSGSNVLLLDAELMPLRHAPIGGGKCARAPDAVVDARLIRVGETPMMSYQTFSGGGDRCRGHWLSRLAVSFEEAVRHGINTTVLHATVAATWPSSRVESFRSNRWGG